MSKAWKTEQRVLKSYAKQLAEILREVEAIYLWVQTLR